MKREQRLRSAADFQRAREAAPRAWAHPLLVLHAAPNDLDHSRVGVTVSGRVGKAVVRNRVRRRVREAVRQRFLQQLPAGVDVLFIARPASATASWSDLCEAIDQLLRLAATGLARPGV